MNLDAKNERNSTPVCHNDSSKSTISNSKNKVFEQYKATVKTMTEKRAQEMYRDKTFGEEYQAVYLTSNILKVVFSFASACTVFVAILWALKPLFGAIVSTFIALTVCVLLEALKGGIWGKLSKNVLKYKQFPFVLAIAAIGFNLSSVLGSVFGAWQLPNMIEQTEQSAPALIDIDSISGSYVTQIESISIIIAEQSQAGLKTNSNSTKRAISKAMDLQTKQKTSILEEKSKAIEYAKSQNSSLLKAHTEKVKKSQALKEKELSSKQLNCISVALFFELLLMLCLAFGSYYLHRVEIDRTGGTEQETENVTTNGSPSSEPQSQSKGHSAPTIQSKSRKIGFNKGTENVNIQGIDKQPIDVKCDTKRQAVDIKRHKIEYTKICALDSCSTPFIHGHGAQEYCNAKCRKKAYSNRQKANK